MAEAALGVVGAWLFRSLPTPAQASALRLAAALAAGLSALIGLESGGLPEACQHAHEWLTALLAAVAPGLALWSADRLRATRAAELLLVAGVSRFAMAGGLWRAAAAGCVLPTAGGLAAVAPAMLFGGMGAARVAAFLMLHAGVGIFLAAAALPAACHGGKHRWPLGYATALAAAFLPAWISPSARGAPWGAEAYALALEEIVSLDGPGSHCWRFGALHAALALGMAAWSARFLCPEVRLQRARRGRAADLSSATNVEALGWLLRRQWRRASAGAAAPAALVAALALSVSAPTNWFAALWAIATVAAVLAIARQAGEALAPQGTCRELAAVAPFEADELIAAVGGQARRRLHELQAPWTAGLAVAAALQHLDPEAAPFGAVWLGIGVAAAACAEVLKGDMMLVAAGAQRADAAAARLRASRLVFVALGAPLALVLSCMFAVWGWLAVLGAALVVRHAGIFMARGYSGVAEALHRRLFPAAPDHDRGA